MGKRHLTRFVYLKRFGRVSFIARATVYPKKYAHGFVVLCFVVVMQSFIMNSHEVFIHIHQGCFAGTGAIVRLPQCQWSKPDGYGKISQCITTTKHSKAKTVCIFLGIYCILHVKITWVILAEVYIKASPSGLGQYSDVIMNTMDDASHITGVSIVYSTVCSGADQRKQLNSAPLAFLWDIQMWPVNSPHKGPVTWKMFPFDDVIMRYEIGFKRYGPRFSSGITRKRRRWERNL